MNEPIEACINHEVSYPRLFRAKENWSKNIGRPNPERMIPRHNSRDDGITLIIHTLKT
jgi:hypothetical protein